MIPAAPTRQAPGHDLVQFSLPSGQIVERVCPGSWRPAPRPGQKVLLWYDPTDPNDVLIYGRDGRRTDVILIAAGCALVAAGTAIAAFGD